MRHPSQLIWPRGTGAEWVIYSKRPFGGSQAVQGLHRIRHYGLFAKSACADDVARARELLAASNAQSEPTSAAADSSKPVCPCCGGRMIIIEVFARGATPRHRPTSPATVIRIDTS